MEKKPDLSPFNSLSIKKVPKNLTRKELEEMFITETNRALKLQMILDRLILNISLVTDGVLMKDYHYQLNLKHNPDFNY